MPVIYPSQFTSIRNLLVGPAMSCKFPPEAEIVSFRIRSHPMGRDLTKKNGRLTSEKENAVLKSVHKYSQINVLKRINIIRNIFLLWSQIYIYIFCYGLNICRLAMLPYWLDSNVANLLDSLLIMLPIY